MLLCLGSVPKCKALTPSVSTISIAPIIPLSTPIALSAADFSAKYKLSFADAVIYVTAVFLPAILITSDDHFKGLPEVTYFAKNKH
jgi:predicted nucleic acid-binding protein